MDHLTVCCHLEWLRGFLLLRSASNAGQVRDAAHVLLAAYRLAPWHTMLLPVVVRACSEANWHALAVTTAQEAMQGGGNNGSVDGIVSYVGALERAIAGEAASQTQDSGSGSGTLHSHSHLHREQGILPSPDGMSPAAGMVASPAGTGAGTGAGAGGPLQAWLVEMKRGWKLCAARGCTAQLLRCAALDYSQGQVPRALQRIRAATLADDFPEHLIQTAMGQCLLALEREDEALSHFHLALQACPWNKTALLAYEQLSRKKMSLTARGGTNGHNNGSGSHSSAMDHRISLSPNNLGIPGSSPSVSIPSLPDMQSPPVGDIFGEEEEEEDEEVL